MVCEPGLERAALDGVALAQRGQHHLAVGQLGLGVVLPLDVGPQEAREGDDPAAGRELGLLALRPRPRAPSADEADLRARPGGVGHLGGHRALPDQLVEAELVARQRPAAWSGVRKVSPAGRMASWASWAFFTLRS